MRTATAAMIGIVLAGGAMASAQSLGDAAQKAKKKREEKGGAPAPKVITQEDLEASRPPADPVAEPAGAPVHPGGGRPLPREPRPAPPANDPDAPGEVSALGGLLDVSPSSPSPKRSRGVADDERDRAAQESAWRSRAASARAAVEAAEREVRAADQSGGMAVGTCCGDEGHRKAQAESAQRLARARSRLESAKRSLESLEELARREGIPPGWLR